MKFTEFESLMESRGMKTLAEIARNLDATPQAVSNWKARNQIPYHIINKLNELAPKDESDLIKNDSKFYENKPQKNFYSTPNVYDRDSISLFDVILTLAEQIKIIVFTTFIFLFTTFIYVKFIQSPKYQSSATVLLPEKKINSFGGLAGLASQFGVNVPMEATADLSSPSLYPELLKSRTFAKKLLKKEFYLNKYSKKLSLLAILTYGDGSPKIGEDTLLLKASEKLNKEYIEFLQDPKSSFSTIRVTANEPVFAKDLAVAILDELESLNRYFKIKNVNEKNIFIENRIASVEEDLKESEKALKDFNERNRQISSPSLQLELKRLERDVEVQIGVYLTLKQQLELAKIEEVQESSVVQILDQPSIPFKPSNKNLILSLIIALITGVVCGITIGFIRSYLNSNDLQDRKKFRRTKHFFWKKLNDITKDRRIIGSISGLLLICSPLFFLHKSANPTYFGFYSKEDLLLNLFYLIILSIFLIRLKNLSKINMSGPQESYID